MNLQIPSPELLVTALPLGPLGTFQKLSGNPLLLPCANQLPHTQNKELFSALIQLPSVEWVQSEPKRGKRREGSLCVARRGYVLRHLFPRYEQSAGTSELLVMLSEGNFKLENKLKQSTKNPFVAPHRRPHPLS